MDVGVLKPMITGWMVGRSEALARAEVMSKFFHVLEIVMMMNLITTTSFFLRQIKGVCERGYNPRVQRCI